MRMKGAGSMATDGKNKGYDIDDKGVAGDRKFLYILKNDRPTLLDRLQSLGLLASFLEAENGTKQEP